MSVRDVLPEVPRCSFVEFEGRATGGARIVDAHAKAGNRIEITVGAAQERWNINTGVYLHRDDVVKILRDYAERCQARFNDDTDAPARLADDYGAMADFFEWQGT